MTISKKQVAALFLQRSKQQWIVRDPEGTYWIVPFSEDGWDQREPFEPTEETELEPLPGHYRYLIRLPF